MDLQLEGKRALVTGSTAGIGLAIAGALAAEGAEVIINGRTIARVNEAIAQLLAKSRSASPARSPAPRPKLLALAADLGNSDGCAQAIAAHPDVDILVNSVGIFEAVPFAEIGDANWQKLFEVNVMSGVRLSRHHLPRMIARNAGRIIFVSSESGLQIPSEMIHYGVTKTAQLALSRGLAELTRATKVTVNTVLPGPTRSEGVAAFVEQLARAQKASSAQVERDFFLHARPTSLLQRFESPEEIADLVAFVASPKSSGINGAALRVDGGVVRSIA